MGDEWSLVVVLGRYVVWLVRGLIIVFGVGLVSGEDDIILLKMPFSQTSFRYSG